MSELVRDWTTGAFCDRRDYWNGGALVFAITVEEQHAA